jgi:hypothetical protein
MNIAVRCLDRDPPGLNKKVSGTISELFPESSITVTNFFLKMGNVIELFFGIISL